MKENVDERVGGKGGAEERKGAWERGDGKEGSSESIWGRVWQLLECRSQLQSPCSHQSDKPATDKTTKMLE